MVPMFDESHFKKKKKGGEGYIYSLSKTKKMTKSETNQPRRSETSTCLRHHILTIATTCC